MPGIDPERAALILERVRSLALVRGLRAVEQNPETSYVIAGALAAYPRATAVRFCDRLISLGQTAALPKPV